MNENKDAYKVITRIFPLWIMMSLLVVPVAGQTSQKQNKEKVAVANSVDLLSGIKITQDVSGSAVLNKVISLYVKKTTVMEALYKVAGQAGLKLSYSTQIIPRDKLDQKVTIDLGQVTVHDALWKVLKGTGLRFAVSSNGNLVLMKMQEQTEIGVYQETITGQVTDAATGSSLPGVNIVVKGTNTGTSTDEEGNYTLSVPSLQDTLIFSFVGFQIREIPINRRLEINVQLQPEALEGDELVVVGYGQQKKANLTSAISHVSSEDFTKGAVQDPLQLLAGKVAGLAYSNPSGDPNSAPQINIRGVSTLASSSDPLVVIDGVPGGNLNAIAPEDIKSMDVLKGGSAAAIYGSRANGGVIIVTTKQGGENNVSVEYGGSLSIDQVKDRIDVLSADEYRNLSQTTGLNNLTISDRGYSTNWQNEILRSPLNQVHHLSINGGDSNSNYMASFNYRDDGGIMLNSNKKSFISRLSLNRRLFDDRLQFNIDISDNLATSQDVWYNAYLTSLIKNPTDSVYFENGLYADYAGQPLNPVAQLKTEDQKNRWNQLKINGKVSVEPLKNWDISFFGAYQRYDNDFAQSNNFQNQSTTLNHLDSQVWLNGAQTWDKTLEVTSEYVGSIKNHNYTAIGGYTYQDFNNQNYSIYAYNFPTDRFGPWNAGLAESTVDGQSEINSDLQSSKRVAFFGRVNYDYDNKYLLMLSLRREGSSKFGDNHKWGLFPGGSVGWRISDESFMDNITFIDNLKLRAGYGVTGIQPSDNYLSLSLLQYGSRAYLNGQWMQGVIPSSNTNPDLRWEKKEEINVGLDFSVFEKLDGSIDYYSRKTNDLLYLYNVPVPPNLYGQTWANVGDIKNEGIEVALNTTAFANQNINWSVGGTYSYNTNKLLKFSNDTYQLDFINAGWTGSPIQQPTHQVNEGQAIGNFYGWKSIDLDSNGNWLVENAEGETVSINQAGEEDKQVLGNGIPKMYASFYSNLKYKNFDFSLTLRGAFKYQILNQYRMQFETISVVGNGNVPQSVLDKPFSGETYIQGSPQYVSHYIENGDFVKISNVAIGYTVPVQSQNVVKKLRLYVSGIDLYTFTGYSGLDPEVSIKGLDPGMDYMEKYPSTRRFTVGVQLSL